MPQFKNIFVLFTATRKKKRRTRTVRRKGTATEGRTGTAAETNANAPTVRKKRAKTKNEIGTASPTARKEMLRYVEQALFRDRWLDALLCSSLT